MLGLNTGLDHSDDTCPATAAELVAYGMMPAQKSSLPWWLGPQDRIISGMFGQ